MVSIVKTVAPIGFEGSRIEVECDMPKSLPSLQIVGLGNKAIDEAKDRIRSTITNSFLEFPKKKITINLAPAELPKDGAHYDLPIALAILCISGQMSQSELSNSIFAGELALDGKIRPIKGVINIVQKAKMSGYKTIHLPHQNTHQAGLISGVTIFGIKSLKELFLHLKQEVLIEPYSRPTTPTEKAESTYPRRNKRARASKERHGHSCSWPPQYLAFGTTRCRQINAHQGSSQSPNGVIRR
jgi:magnesium chelatase family protein